MHSPPHGGLLLRCNMNILIIATGGTIGSAFDGSSINVRSDGRCAVAERYAAEHRDIHFEVISPLNILSESLTAADLNKLAGAMFAVDYSRYDGVIITVGSDNLAYLSSFVGLLLGDRTPLYLVAANLVLSDPASNGYVNFDCAVALIRQGMRGAFVPYRNMDGVMYVHSATDIRQADLCEDFYSFHGAYGVFENGALRVCRPLVSQRAPVRYDAEHLPRLQDNVLMLHPYPMQDYERICVGGARAVLHTLYHSATLDAQRAIAFLQTLGDIPLFLASFRSGRKRYQTAVDVIDAGAVPLCDISPECAYIKLLLACAQDEMSIEEFMEVTA